MRAIPLLAALLAAAPAASEPRLCSYNTRPPRWTAGSRECLFLSELALRVERLAAVAGTPEVRLVPYISGDEFPNAGQDSPNMIWVNRGFVECLADDLPAATASMSHEMAHHQQHEMGLIVKARSARTEAELDRNLTKLEAEADQRGTALLRAAGFGGVAEDVIPALERCIPRHYEYDRFATKDHPSIAARWIEGVRERERAGLEKARRAADGGLRLAGELRSGAPPPAVLPSERGATGYPARSPQETRRLHAGIPPPFDRTPPNGIVDLPGGGIWEIPEHLRRFSPAELIAFVGRGGTLPDSIAEAFRASLETLERLGGWESLPGQVGPPDKPPSQGNLRWFEHRRFPER